MPSMIRISRTVIAAVTIAAMIISALWATSPDALTDAMKVEMVVLDQHPAAMDTAAAHLDKHDQTTPAQPCNHGCHAAAHLLGLFEVNADKVAPSLVIRVASVDLDQLRINPLLQGPYRPPLTHPLV